MDFLPRDFMGSFSHPLVKEAFRLKLGGLIAIGFGIMVLILSFFESVRTILKSSDRIKAMSECLTMLLLIIF